MKYLAFLSLTILMSCTASKPTVNPITNNEGDLEGIITTENLKEALSSVYGIDMSWLAQLWGWTHFPQMGIKGAALATVIASVWMVLHYCFYLFYICTQNDRSRVAH